MSFPGSDLVRSCIGNGGVDSSLVGGWRHSQQDLGEGVG